MNQLSAQKEKGMIKYIKRIKLDAIHNFRHVANKRCCKATYFYLHNNQYICRVPYKF